VLALLGVSLVVLGLDLTVLNVALPTLVVELGASTSDLQWIIDAYALMAGSLMLLGGSLADRLGRKRVFLAGLGLFSAASAAAAYADSVTTLILARGAMGVAEALIMPATLAIIGHLFRDPGERIKALGVWSGAVGLGTAAGPVVGGWLLGQFWWGSVFLVNVPIGVAAIAAAAVLVPNSRAESPRRFDPVGVVLSIAAPGLLLWAIIEGPLRGWDDPVVLGGFAVAAILALGFVAWERGREHPMLPLSIFRHRALTGGVGVMLLGAVTLMGVLFVLTQYLQFVLRYSASESGLRIAPAALVVLVAAPLAAVVAQRLGRRPVVVASLGLAVVSLGLIATMAPSDGYGRLLVALLLLGSGMGGVMATASDAIVGSLPEADLAVGSATNSAAIQFGDALGIAVIGSVLSDVYAARLPAQAPEPARESLGTALEIAARLPDHVGSTLVEAARGAFVDAIPPATYVGIGAIAAAIVIALTLFPSRRKENS
jgi:EmrB/QacA subfamily drug resistance transporter